MPVTTTSGSPHETPDHAVAESGTTQAQDLDSRAFRTVLGSFATGVTVVTALAPDGGKLGVTVSSFNSVSLDPPLILWSLSRSSPSLAAFEQASHYAINVLADHQQSLSDRFAVRDNDRFVGILLRDGRYGIPLLEGCCAWFECRNEVRYAGGDHLIFVGHVENFGAGPAQAPLVFHGGSYRRLRGD